MPIELPEKPESIYSINLRNAAASDDAFATQVHATTVATCNYDHPRFSLAKIQTQVQEFMTQFQRLSRWSSWLHVGHIGTHIDIQVDRT